MSPQLFLFIPLAQKWDHVLFHYVLSPTIVFFMPLAEKPDQNIHCFMALYFLYRLSCPLYFLYNHVFVPSQVINRKIGHLYYKTESQKHRTDTHKNRVTPQVVCICISFFLYKLFVLISFSVNFSVLNPVYELLENLDGLSLMWIVGWKSKLIRGERRDGSSRERRRD